MKEIRQRDFRHQMYGEANQRSSDDTPEQRAPLRGSEVPALGGLEESVEILAQFSNPRNASIRQAVLGVRYEEPSRSSSHNTAVVASLSPASTISSGPRCAKSWADKRCAKPKTFFA